MAKKIVITGAAGLVGLNLIPRLMNKGFTKIVAIDKHPINVAVLRKFHPTIRILHTNLAAEESSAQEWQQELVGSDALVIAQAQIGGTDPVEFVRNNVVATERLLEAARKYRVPYIVGISSSVVNSMAKDDYTETKKAQEAVIASSGIKQIILRPTLMFGWFDRKHVGWLARFMKKVPIFPIPGSGKFLRQPLYAGDFCNVIASSIEREMTGAHNITGMDRIDYIDLIRAVKAATGATAHIQRIPYGLFWTILKVNAMFDKDPAFTIGQLKALVTPDIFELIDWPAIFQIRATPLQEALNETFRHPQYSSVALDF